MHRRTGASFGKSPNSIWVCDQHRSLHGRLVADGMIDFIQSPFAIVLDYGCGEALSADRVAARCGKLILCDAAGSVRSVLSKRYTGHGNVKVIAPEDVPTIPAESLDLIVANSVVQYMPTTEVESLLDLFHPRLRNSGTLVIGDVIPPGQMPGMSTRRESTAYSSGRRCAIASAVPSSSSANPG